MGSLGMGLVPYDIEKGHLGLFVTIHPGSYYPSQSDHGKSLEDYWNKLVATVLSGDLPVTHF